MKKIIKKIDVAIGKGVNKKERDEILSYYEEIILDRLERGGSLNEIDKSIDYKRIRRETVPTIINQNSDQSIKSSMKSSSKMLAYLFTSPLWIPLAILYLALLIVVVAIMFSLIMVIVSLPLAGVMLIVRMVWDAQVVALILTVTGSYIVAASISSLAVYAVYRGFKLVFSSLTKLISRIVLGKKAPRANDLKGASV